MIHLITYHDSRSNEQHTIEWVAPSNWSQLTIAEHFERAFPAATAIIVSPIPRQAAAGNA